MEQSQVLRYEVDKARRIVTQYFLIGVVTGFALAIASICLIIYLWSVSQK